MARVEQWDHTVPAIPTHEPSARRHRPLAATHCANPRKDGQAELTWVAGSYRDKCPTPGIKPGHGHPSQY